MFEFSFFWRIRLDFGDRVIQNDILIDWIKNSFVKAQIHFFVFLHIFDKFLINQFIIVLNEIIVYLFSLIICIREIAFISWLLVALDILDLFDDVKSRYRPFAWFIFWKIYRQRNLGLNLFLLGFNFLEMIE